MTEFSWTDFSSDVGMTALGTLFGIGAALWYDRRQKKIDEDETRNETLNLIKSELEQFKSFGVNYFKKPIEWNPSTRDFEGTYPTITFDTFQSSLFSGNFSLLKPKLQGNLGLVNVKIETIKQYANQIINFHTSSVYTDEQLSKREAERICDSTNGVMRDLMEKTDEALKMMADKS